MHYPKLHFATKLHTVRAIALGVIAFFTQGAEAATTVCGLVENQHWTSNGSPYLITCDVQVDSLTIDPCVVVQFQSNYVFQITGFLVAKGAPGCEILFTTTNAAAGWQGIFFNEVLPLSVLDYCIMERSKNSGVRIEDSIVEISNCLFRNNSASRGGAININNTLAGFGELMLSRCTFSNNISAAHGGAVLANMGNNSIRFECCSILSNAANPSQVSGSYVGGGLYVSGDCKLNNCLIAGNTVRGSGFDAESNGGGIYLDGNGDADFENCTITNNSSIVSGPGIHKYSVGGGVCLGNGTLLSQNCIVAYNSSSGGNVTAGSGIYIYSGAGLLLNCTIAYNNTVGLWTADNRTFVRNSILYFNNSGGTQLSGTTNVFYSDVQNGNINNGNIVSQPSLNPACLRITFNSPCKDKGDPDPAYNDACIDDTDPCALVSRGTSRNDMGAHGGPGACLWDACDSTITPPTIIGQSASPLSSCLGQGASLFATATGTPPLSYQWWFGRTQLSGQTNSTLVFTNLQSTDAGVYSVVVSNPYGSTNSAIQLNVNDACIDIRMYAGLTIAGQAGKTYVLKYTTELGNTNFANWTPLATNTMGISDWFYLDMESPFSPRRFYGVKLEP